MNINKILLSIISLLLTWQMSYAFSSMISPDPCEQIAGDWSGIWENSAPYSRHCKWPAQVKITRNNETVQLEVYLAKGNKKHCDEDGFTIVGTCKYSKLKLNWGGIQLYADLTKIPLVLYGYGTKAVLQKSS